MPTETAAFSAISWSPTKPRHSEAKERGISFVDHVSHLVVHGMLHLLGFDHADDADAERMERVERVALASIGVADPYADGDEFRLAEALP